MARLPTFEEVEQAVPRVLTAAVRTPLVRLNAPNAPAEIHLKLENLQPIGAFKLRGAVNCMAEMDPASLAAGVLTASSGNMAKAVAWNARRLGLACVVVVPDTSPISKRQAVERLGGRVIPVTWERWWQTLTDRSFPGVDGVFVHPFDDVSVMAGNGTISVEALQDLPEAHTFLIPWGGGGLSCGMAVAIRHLKPAARILAIEVESGAPLAAAWEAGHPIVVGHQPSFVDGIGSHTVFDHMYGYARQLLNGVVVVSLDEVADAMRMLSRRNAIVAEGAGAAPVAAALSGRAGLGVTVCVISGGNIDPDKLVQIIDG
jgi:threonine dehydratase